MTSGLVKDRQIKAELGEAGRRDLEGGAPAPSRAVAAQPGPSERVSRIAGQARWNTPHPRSGAPTFQPLRRARMQLARDAGKTPGVGREEPGIGEGCGRKVRAPGVLSPPTQPKVFPHRPLVGPARPLSLSCPGSPTLPGATRWS